MSGRCGDAGLITAWLAQNAIPLRSLNAGHVFDDLVPFVGVLEDVRVVGLGEATHGSREFFTLKHRLVEFLVVELGFTVFAIEAGSSASLAVNDYILHGEGEPSAALRGLGYWTWNTEEMLDLIEWMREHNARIPMERRVKFRGIDPIMEPSGTQSVTEYLSMVAPQRVEDFRQALRTFDVGRTPVGLLGMARELARSTLDSFPGKRRKSGAAVEPARRARDVVRDTFTFVTQNRDTLIAASSTESWADAADHLWALDLAAEIALHPALGSVGSANRDQYMAEAVHRILDAEPEATRLIVWAHNGHVGRGALGPGAPSMGSHLRDRYHNGYYALGFAFNQGAFQALKATSDNYTEPVEFTLGPAEPGTVEWDLTRPHLGDYLIDLRVAQHDETAWDWVNRPSRMRSFGSVIGFWPLLKKSTGPVSLAHDYDGLAFVDRTSRARANSPRSRAPRRSPR